MSKALIRLDLMAGTKDPSKLVSLQYHNGTAYAAIPNGAILKLDSLMANEREMWKAVAVDADADTIASGKLVVVASPEWIDDERKRNLDEFENVAGEAARGYVLCVGDTFSVTAEGFASNATPTATKKYAWLTDGYLITAAATAPSSANKIGDIIATETVGSKTFYVIRVCA